MRFKQKISIGLFFLSVCILAALPVCLAQEVKSMDYVVKVGDELEVTVYQEKDLSGLFEVDTFGNISMPLVGDVKVEGLRLDKARDAVIQAFKKFIIDPQVSIICRKQAGGSATIFGQIEKPGSYEIIPNMTLTQLIAKAGAFTELADPAQIRVLRTADKGVEAINVNLSEVFSGKSADVVLKDGDVVLVPQELQFQGEGKVTILGAVRNPGTYSRFSGMSLIQLVATAGDFTSDADIQNTRIIRMQEDGTKKLINIDITEVFKGEVPDVPILADDVVVVAKEDSLESERVTLMGQVRKPGIYVFRKGLTLLGVIAMGGDFTEMANTSRVKIIRKQGVAPRVIVVNVRRILNGRASDADLEPGDIITVPEALF